MKRRQLIALISGSTVAAGAGAVAIASGRGGHEYGWGRRAGSTGGRFDHLAGLCGDQDPERTEMLIKYVEAQLDLVPAQRDKWGRLTKALRESGDTLRQTCPAPDAAPRLDDLSAELAGAETMMVAGLAWVRRVRPAYEDFHAGLNDKQKRTLRGIFANRRGRHAR